MRVFLMFAGLMVLTGCLEQEDVLAVETSESMQADTCGSGDLANLVGTPRADVEAMGFVQPVRFIGPGSAAVTTDFNPIRINFLIDEESNVLEVFCG